MPTALLVTTPEELKEIVELQTQNLKQNIGSEEMKSQGFVTMTHNIDVLKQMNDLAPSVLAKEGDQLAGYALTMLKECRNLVPDLNSMFDLLDDLKWKGKELRQYQFYVMGQICVSLPFRGKGVFETLYDYHRKIYSPKFDFIVTEVATRNTRSMRAHEKVGFKIIHQHRDEIDEWAVVLWDWQ